MSAIATPFISLKIYVRTRYCNQISEISTTLNYAQKIFRFILKQKHYISSDSYISFLKSKGIKIGNDCIFREPRTTYIDLTRPWLISIGNRVDMNVNFHIYTHDWGGRVFIGKYNQMLNSSGAVTIGNNIYFGANVTVLKGVNIGDNCIIGAGSTVTHDIPSGSVAVGNPCKVICSLDDYFAKRLKVAPLEAKENVMYFYQRYGRYPYKDELSEESIYYDGKPNLLPLQIYFVRNFLDWCKDSISE